MAGAHDSVLLLAFGGPTRLEEVRPFLANVLRGKRVPPERIEEVVARYELLGGASPLNRLTFQQATGLRNLLGREGPALPVYVGMRHWEPYIHDTLATMAGRGHRRAVGLVLAAHPSHASREAYHEAVNLARRRLGGGAPEVDYSGPWFDHPEFIEALVARVREAGALVPPERRAAAALVYTGHSIPAPMSEASGYARSLARTAELVSAALGVGQWTIAYQSRSGSPQDPWLEPDLGDALRDLAGRGVRDAVVAPIGFVCDHIEVLYDLDIEARAVAGKLGIGFFRAPTVGDHPSFLSTLAAVVRDTMPRPGS